MQPAIAVIVPCRNEEKYIGRCLDSLLSSDYPLELLNIVIVDGMSTDETCNVAKGYEHNFEKFHILKNPQKTKPAALNLGIRNTCEEIVARVDAHAEYAPDYFSRLVSTLEDLDADLVGARRITSLDSTFWGKVITASIDHRFAAGDAHYRTSPHDRPREVASVFCGLYRRRAFQRIGLFNESLIRTQDRELNTRIKESHGRIVLDPRTSCTYFARTHINGYLRWVFDGAFWLFYARRFSPTKMSALRNYIPVLFVIYLLTLIAVLGLPLPRLALLAAAIPLMAYCTLSFLSAWQVAGRLSNWLLILPIMSVFLLTHFVYGLGSLTGLICQKLSPKRQVETIF